MPENNRFQLSSKMPYNNNMGYLCTN